MTKRVTLPTAVAAIALAWTTAAHADNPNANANNATQKANDAANQAADKACDTANKASHATKSAKKSADQATSGAAKKSGAAKAGATSAASGATKKVDEAAAKTGAAVNGASDKVSDTANKAKSDIEETGANANREVKETANTATGKVETTSGNIFTAERPSGERPNRALLYGGAGLLVLSYVPAAIVGIASSKGKDAWMALPVVGPWIALGAGGRPWTGNVAIAADGVIQGISAASMVASLIVPESEMPIGMNAKLRILPTTMGKDGYGLGAGGTF